ncbi:ubiquitin-conjugating enzyme/RWD-like protein [Panaeolus papilionaceus]|nr:ubiquitin-conjugating enzyme/RWD-like protein [Panaeolus papilionaceus]
MTMKRIQREIVDLKKEDLGEITLEPSESDMHVWKGSIPGPQGSVYDGGIFDVEIQLPQDYPFSAPRVVFKTRIYHMNISESGSICIDILKHNWSPALSLFKVMLSLSSLLTDPNPKDPLVPNIATQYTRNRKVHDATARKWTEMYARKAPPPPPPAPAAVPQPTIVVVDSSPPSVPRHKGKARAEGPPSVGAAAGASSSRSTRPAEVIVLSDSEDEARNSGKGKKRKRGEDKASTNANAGPSASVPRVAPSEVLDLTESDTEKDKVPVPAKKPRTRNPPSKAESSAPTRRSTRRRGAADGAEPMDE